MPQVTQKQAIAIVFVLVAIAVVAVLLVKHQQTAASYNPRQMTATPIPAGFPAIAPATAVMPASSSKAMPQSQAMVGNATMMPATIGVSMPTTEISSTAATAAPVMSMNVMDDNDFQEYLAAWNDLKVSTGDAGATSWAKHVIVSLKDMSLTPAQAAQLQPDNQITITAKALSTS